MANAGNDELAAARDRILDDRRETRALIVRLMNAIAIGRFEQQHIGRRRL